MFFSRLKNFNEVFIFIFKIGIKNNIPMVMLIVLLGVVNKIMLLASVIMLVQAIFAVLMPKYFIEIVNKITSSYGVVFESNEAIVISVLLILFVQILYLLTQHLNTLFNNSLINKILSPKTGLKWKIFDDFFIIDQFTKSIISTLKFFTAIIYLIILTIVMTYLSKDIVVVLMPTILLMVLIQVYVSRKDLHYQNDLKLRKSNLKKYNNQISSISDPLMIIESDARRKYIEAKENLLKRTDKKNQINTILVTVFVIIMILILTELPNQNKDNLTSVLIFFLFAIRSILATGKEISIFLSQILELRKNKKVINKILFENIS